MKIEEWNGIDVMVLATTVASQEGVVLDALLKWAGVEDDKEKACQLTQAFSFATTVLITVAAKYAQRYCDSTKTKNDWLQELGYPREQIQGLLRACAVVMCQQDTGHMPIFSPGST